MFHSDSLNKLDRLFDGEDNLSDDELDSYWSQTVLTAETPRITAERLDAWLHEVGHVCAAHTGTNLVTFIEQGCGRCPADEDPTQVRNPVDAVFIRADTSIWATCSDCLWEWESCQTPGPGHEECPLEVEHILYL